MTLNDGSSHTFQVKNGTNGAKGDKGDKGDAPSFAGNYVSNTDYTSLPVGLTYIELPGTVTVEGDPTYATCLTTYYSSNRAFQLASTNGNNPILYLRALHINNSSNAGTGYSPWKQMWGKGDAITGAVWNDYAEYRESDCEDFGYVLTENGDDTLSKTTERLQHFAGISSDTWGFCQGETEKAKTPIAVAGRVLAYPYRALDEYKPGDCVCAAPDGTVDIMTREEIQQYPDRIVGTVSCVPTYETWGSGDRDPVQVNGRIWIKIK